MDARRGDGLLIQEVPVTGQGVVSRPGSVRQARAPARVRAVLVTGVMVMTLGGLVACTVDTADPHASTRTTTATRPSNTERHYRIPPGWPPILALDPDAEIVFVVDNSHDGEYHQVVIARVDGIGQQVFGLYADALKSGGYDVTIDHVAKSPDNLNWALHATSGPHDVTVRVSSLEDGNVEVRLTHEVGPTTGDRSHPNDRSATTP